MPHVPDTVPGKRVPDAGARTEGRGQPSNIRGGSRMQESCTYGCVSSEGWHVQQGTNLPGQKSEPRSLDSGGDGNRTFEAYRQDLPRGGYESPGRNKSKRIVASKMSIPEGRARNRRAKAE